MFSYFCTFKRSINEMKKYPELQVAIDSLKPGKASGPDNISSEHTKHLGVFAQRVLLLILNVILQSGHCPKSGRQESFCRSSKAKEKALRILATTVASHLLQRSQSCSKPASGLASRRSCPSKTSRPTAVRLSQRLLMPTDCIQDHSS